MTLGDPASSARATVPGDPAGLAIALGAGKPVVQPAPDRATMRTAVDGTQPSSIGRRVAALASGQLQHDAAPDTLVGALASTIELLDPAAGGSLQRQTDSHPEPSLVSGSLGLWVGFGHPQMDNRGLTFATTTRRWPVPNQRKPTRAALVAAANSPCSGVCYSPSGPGAPCGCSLICARGGSMGRTMSIFSRST